ncbi:MAG TPA: class I SAM-dependent methyltransferase [Holophagaceae bacterium]|jgi:SAM-dependent methyltransferase|nr:class I SAM-dependent methyltransferase [Holophagaceae bacterium]
MSQTTSGLRSVLSLPASYSLLQRLVGAGRSRRILCESYIQASVGERVLDIGCGTADILDHLPAVDYSGFDLNPRYVASAQRRFGSRGAFRCEDVGKADLGLAGGFDLVLALAILHHLDDGEVVGLFELARGAMKPGGRLVTFDSCYVEGQSRAARFLIDRDRGHNTRTEAGYRALAERVFPSVESHVRHDLLNIPYTHIILKCQA